MTSIRIICMSITAMGCFVTAGQTFAAPIVMSNATFAFSLQGTSNCYQMAVAYNPSNNQYYGGGGGGPGCNGDIWNATGTKLQSLSPINVDIRGVNYNANNGSIEVIGYGSRSGYGSGSGYSGLYKMGLDGSGFYTGINTQVLGSLPGTASDQSVAAYDSGRDVFYSHANGSDVTIVSHSDGSLKGTLHLTGTSLSGVNNYAIGYDSSNDALIKYSYASNQALVFDLTGAFIGASTLGGGSYDPNYSMSYSNGLLFVGKGSNAGYDAYQIIEEAPITVPEPTTVALMGLGFLGFAASRRKSARSKST